MDAASVADPIAGSPPDLVLRFPAERSPEQFLSQFLRQLADGLGRAGLRLELREGGALSEGDTRFGSVVLGPENREIGVEIRPVNWAESPPALLSLRVEPTARTGSELTIEVRGWPKVLEAAGGTFEEWTAAALLPAVLRELAPGPLGEWVMDQQARRPAGAAAVETYRDPTYHWPGFLLILDRLRLTPNDRLLEVGFGGGAFLKKALESGCSASGVDHSPEMVRLAGVENRAAVEAGRLRLFEGDAGALPVPGDAFTACVCTIAFSFFPDPSASLGETLRALRPDGRLALFVETAALRASPASPEPFASRSHFYQPGELAELARSAGFTDVRVEEPAPSALRQGRAPASGGRERLRRHGRGDAAARPEAPGEVGRPPTHRALIVPPRPAHAPGRSDSPGKKTVRSESTYASSWAGGGRVPTGSAVGAPRGSTPRRATDDWRGRFEDFVTVPERRT